MRTNLSQPPASRRIVFLLAACAVLVSPSVFAQAIPQPSAPGAPADAHRQLAFEVVSIRPSKPDEPTHLFFDTDQYHALGLPLGRTILLAYFPFPLHTRERLRGAPAWVWNDRFDFVAKVAPEDLQEWQNARLLGTDRPNPTLEAMLQAALEDRCKLRVHRIPATTAGFALVVAAHGPNRNTFSPSKPDEIIPDNALKIHVDGRMVPFESADDPVLRFYATSTMSLATFLSDWGTPVEDRTGLTGKYDFKLARVSNTGDVSLDLDVAALGLKLTRITIPIEDIVIDHIEYPSPN